MKGINAMTMILILLLVAFAIFGWISTNQSVGTEQTEEISRATLFGEADRRLQKASLFLQSSLGISAQKGSQNASDRSGRISREQEASYWLCKGAPQPPKKDTAAATLANATGFYMQDRIDQIRGMRQNWLYDPGKTSCLAAGYNTPLNSPENDHFSVGVELDSLTVQNREGRIARSSSPLKIEEKVNYNRYWYLYSKLSEWVENNKLKKKIRKHLREIPDQGQVSKKVCVQKASECRYPSQKPFSCREKHIDSIETEVNEGMQEELRRMETSPDVFNETGVKCSYRFNKITLSASSTELSYPGGAVYKIGQNKKAVKKDCPMICPGGEENMTPVYAERWTGECEGGMKTRPRTICEDIPDGGQECEEDGVVEYCPAEDRVMEEVKIGEDCAVDRVKNCPECGKEFECIKSWDLGFEAFVDATVSCRDTKFNTVPREEKLEHLEWKFNTSFTVQESQVGGGTFDCRNKVDLNTYHQPVKLKTCSMTPESPDLCRDPESLKGELD
jgi:hypothetical protein